MVPRPLDTSPHCPARPLLSPRHRILFHASDNKLNMLFTCAHDNSADLSITFVHRTELSATWAEVDRGHQLEGPDAKGMATARLEAA